MSALSMLNSAKRHFDSGAGAYHTGIVCECCVNRCSLKELQGYCSAKCPSSAPKPKRDGWNHRQHQQQQHQQHQSHQRNDRLHLDRNNQRLLARQPATDYDETRLGNTRLVPPAADDTPEARDNSDVIAELLSTWFLHTRACTINTW